MESLVLAKKPIIISSKDLYLAKFHGPTQQNYSSILTKIENFINSHPEYLEQLDTNYGVNLMFSHFVMDANAQSINSFRLYRTIFQSYLYWLFDNDLLPKRMKLDYKFLMTDEYRKGMDRKRLVIMKRLLTKEEFKRVLEYIKNFSPHLYIPYVLWWNFGLRAGEVREIKKDDFTKVDGKMYFMRYGKAQKRSQRASYKLIPPSMEEKIEKHFASYSPYKDGHQYLLTKCRYNVGLRRVENSNEPIASNQGVLLQLSLIVKKILGKKIKTHDIRRSRATSLLLQGVHTYDICKMIDMSPATLKKYDYIIPDLSSIERSAVGEDE